MHLTNERKCILWVYRKWIYYCPSDVIRAERRELNERKSILYKIPQKMSIFKLKIQQKLLKFLFFKPHIFLEAAQGMTVISFHCVEGWWWSQTSTQSLAHSHRLNGKRWENRKNRSKKTHELRDRETVYQLPLWRKPTWPWEISLIYCQFKNNFKIYLYIICI